MLTAILIAISLFVLALHCLTSLIMRALAAKRQGPGIDVSLRSSSRHQSTLSVIHKSG